MPITTKVPEEIVGSMLDIFSALVTTSVDRNPGSVIRTIFEAAALLDAEQMIQAARALEAFYLDTATGDDLDRRALDFNLVRYEPQSAKTRIIFGMTDDTGEALAVKTATALAANVAIGAATISLKADPSTFGTGNTWPASGTIVINSTDGSSRRESIAYTSISGTTVTLTGVTKYTHYIGDTVAISVQGADNVVAAGTRVYAPATAITPDIVFTTSAPAIIYDGFATSAAVEATADLTGAGANVPANYVTQFTSPPFQNAIVSSHLRASGGRDRETDSEFRSRLRLHIMSLGKSNLAGLEGGVLGVTVSDETGTSIINSAQAVESITTPGVVALYVDDGSETGISTAVTSVQQELLFGPATTFAGDTHARFSHAPIVSSSTVYLYKSTYTGTTTSILNQTQVEDTTATFPVPLTGGVVNWRLVDAAGQILTITANDATSVTTAVDERPVFGAYALVRVVGGSNVGPSPGTAEFSVNYSTGDVYKTAGLAARETVIAYATTAGYQYHGGVVEEAQKVVNGVKGDTATYPGLKAQGTFVTVTPAQIVSPAKIAVTVIPMDGFTHAMVDPYVLYAVKNYVNGLPVANDIILAKIVQAILGVNGVRAAYVTLPTSDYNVPDGSVAKITDAAIEIT